MRKLLKFIIPLSLILIIITSTLIYLNRTYLYLPFTVPSAITQKHKFDYKWFKKPTTVEVMVDEGADAPVFIRSLYYPKDKGDYENLARKTADLYATILEKGTRLPPEASLTEHDTSGLRYVTSLRCGDTRIIPIDFMDSNEIIQLSGDFYEVTPELRDELVNYIKQTYPIKEVVN